MAGGRPPFWMVTRSNRKVRVGGYRVATGVARGGNRHDLTRGVRLKRSGFAGSLQPDRGMNGWGWTAWAGGPTGALRTGLGPHPPRQLRTQKSAPPRLGGALFCVWGLADDGGGCGVPGVAL